MKILKKEEKVCAYCQKVFLTDKINKKYCSSYCARKARCKVKKRPVARTLKKLMLSHSFTEIGEMYGVSGNAVRKWCKRYGIEYHHSYIKEQRDKIKAQEKKNKQPRHLDYTEASVKMTGYYKHNKEFKNIYEAADYVKRNRWTKSPINIIIASIKRAILGERQTYLGCTWESSQFIEEHNNSLRCKHIEKEEDKWQPEEDRKEVQI